MKLLLFWSTLYLQTPDDTVSQDLSLEEKWSTFQIEPKITVSVILGNATELQCRNETSEGKYCSVSV